VIPHPPTGDKENTLTERHVTETEVFGNLRATCEGRFTLPRPVAEVVPLFTPEGERDWVGSSWDPVYALPEGAGDGSAPGTVFTTESTGGRATWIVLERRENGMRYARIAADRIAGTIDVTCTPAASGTESEVTVIYDVTSLGPEGAAFVEEHRAGYDRFLEGWRQAILAYLDRGSAVGGDEAHE
jgi:hypothetical protein